MFERTILDSGPVVLFAGICPPPFGRKVIGVNGRAVNVPAHAIDDFLE